MRCFANLYFRSVVGRGCILSGRVNAFSATKIASRKFELDDTL